MEVGRKKHKGPRCLRFGIWEKLLLQKPKGHRLAIWALGRSSFQNSRRTVLAIECLGRIFKKKTKGHGACDLGFGKG